MSSTLLADSRRKLLGSLGSFESEKNSVYRSRKVVHDTVWGTCRFEPWEMALLEFPLFQRLRGLRQTGFAYLTYPAAEHSRFQHTLGVAAASTKILRSIIENGTELPAAFSRPEDRERWIVLTRLAALVHDLGHSVFSHTSERVFELTDPFPALRDELVTSGKRPGAAEVVVYLLITSAEWKAAVDEAWAKTGSRVEPPSASEWERIGHWVTGQEDDPSLKFLADVISGPIDADKLDYVFRDGYTAGIPVGYDLERLVTTICVDRQSGNGKAWDRLTLPLKGINALEQLVMGRLVLNSYLYHHQKCRAAEAAFERLLAREYRLSKSLLGFANVWDLFSAQDADVLAFAKSAAPTAQEVRDLLNRRLRVRVTEFRLQDLKPKSGRISEAFEDLTLLGLPDDWDSYWKLLDLEDEIADDARVPRGSVIVDVPRLPKYSDLENLLLPGRKGQRESPTDVLNYRDWIAAYNDHRAWIRVYGPRGAEREARVWDATCRVLRKRGLELPPSLRLDRD